MVVSPGTQSIWSAEVPFPFFPTLDVLGSVDVIVIGGGISGVTTALLLQQAGLATAVIEQARLGSGESGRTSAHLTEYLDGGYGRIITDFGIEGARAVAESQREAIRLIESLSQEIPCDFRRVSGFLYSEHARDRTSLQEQIEGAAEVGLAGRFLDRAPLPFETAGAIEFPFQAQFHPAKYLAGLVRLYAAAGGVISEQSHVRSIDEEDGRCRVRTDRAIAYARHVVAVTDAPITGGTLLDTKLAANRSYVVALGVLESDLVEGLFWDTDDPYHYMRSVMTHDGPILLVGGEDHRTGADEATDSVGRLEAFARERFPVERIVKEWSGQIMEPVDGLPLIGPREAGSRVYLATGYAGNGLTFGTAAAQLISSLIRGAGSAVADWYSPTRTLATKLWAKYAAQNLPAAWTLVSDMLPQLSGQSIDALAPGDGCVVRLQGQRVAASRDLDGGLHCVTATCTHLGCEVVWNRLEQSWDCPCHGSRFDPDGHVIHGPATSALQVITDEPGAEPTSTAGPNNKAQQ